MLCPNACMSDEPCMTLAEPFPMEYSAIVVWLHDDGSYVSCCAP